MIAKKKQLRVPSCLETHHPSSFHLFLFPPLFYPFLSVSISFSLICHLTSLFPVMFPFILSKYSLFSMFFVVTVVDPP